MVWSLQALYVLKLKAPCPLQLDVKKSGLAAVGLYVFPSRHVWTSGGACRFRRPPGLSSSFLGLRSLTSQLDQCPWPEMVTAVSSPAAPAGLSESCAQGALLGSRFTCASAARGRVSPCEMCLTSQQSRQSILAPLRWCKTDSPALRLGLGRSVASQGDRFTLHRCSRGHGEGCGVARRTLQGP